MLARINRNYVPAFWDDFFNDRFFNQLDTNGHRHQSPAVNVIEDEKAFRIEVAAPGVSRKDFHLELEDDVLTISTEKKENKKEQKANYLRREFNYHSFKRSFQLPETVDQEGIQASHDSGVLTVNLPKREEVVQKAPKQIEVQ
jgi:HSP20 family protein